MVTKEEAVRVLKELIIAIHDTIKEAGPEGAPSGIIYAALMEKTNISLEYYNAIINAMIASGKIYQKNYVLYAKT